MGKFKQYIARQFAFPTGLAGRAATLLMNIMNRKQYNCIRLIDMTDSTVLDLGFGNGFLLEKLFSKHPKQLCGIELSTDMVKLVSDKNVNRIESGLLNIQQADVAQIPYPTAYFDIVYTVNTFYFWNDTNGALSEILRVLKPDGLFYNVFYTKQWLDKLSYTRYGFAKYNTAEIEKMLIDNGFSIEKTIEISRDKAFCIVGTKK